jgi:hypothetical protein
MAVPLLIVRRLVWLLLVGLGLAMLCGCTQRDETNPFIGPNGDAQALPFG